MGRGGPVFIYRVRIKLQAHSKHKLDKAKAGKQWKMGEVLFRLPTADNRGKSVPTRHDACGGQNNILYRHVHRLFCHPLYYRQKEV